MRLSFIHTLVLLVAVFFSAPAQIQAQAIGEKNVSVNISPTNPSPGENYTLSLITYSFDLNRSTITWSVNGTKILSGIGKSTYEGVMGSLGETTQIKIVIEAGLLVIEKNISLVGTDMDLIWEAIDSYVPPFYKGKALPSPEARINVVAIPLLQDGTSLLGSDNITYAWNRNYSPDLGSSGYGKNSFIFRTSYLNQSDKITASSTAITKNLSAKQTIDIRTIKPKILFYPIQNKSANTIHALKNSITVNGDSYTIIAVPYFFSGENPDVKDLSYTWKVNNQQLQVFSPKNTLTIQKGEATNGTIDLTIESISKLLQSAKSKMTINFQK